MERILYSLGSCKCTLQCSGNTEFKTFGKWNRWKIQGNPSIARFSLRLTGKEWTVFWPNREGERFTASAVGPALEKYNCPNGLTISYPSTASCRTLIFTDTNGEGVIVCAPPDNQGRVTDFLITEHGKDQIEFEVSTAVGDWFSLYFKTWKKMMEAFTALQKTEDWQLLPKKSNEIRWQVQVGLIGPDGKTEVHKNNGFDVLSEISELMLNKLGENNILHVFGYSSGHDMDYPDYTPSSQLGGSSHLEKVVKKIHQNSQKAVFYMNGRIAQKENVEKDGLHDSILTDDNGLPFTEIYHTRNFYVMNPSSEEWQARLFSEAIKLKELGADGIQLDQLGGRAAPVPAGEIWGEGYIKLINNLHKEELSVWIQGLSDIYPADWFELTNRNTNILEDGTIRGGTPLGQSDKRVFQISVPGQILLIPLSKIETKMENKKAHNNKSKNNNIIIDLDLGGEELFLYNPSYMTQLEELMGIAALISK